MQLFSKDDIRPENLPGRRIWKAVGRDAFIGSEKITYGHALYAAEYGSMEPHRHAEEVCFVVNARGAWVRFGPERGKLGRRIALAPGMTMHFPPLEWHAFGYEEGGHVEILFIYGQVDNIRPEEAE